MKNIRPIKSELYQNSFWVYLVWLVFPAAFENISCPSPNFTPMSKFSFLKMGPNTKWGIFAKFVIAKFKMSLKIEIEKIWGWNFQDEFLSWIQIGGINLKKIWVPSAQTLGDLGLNDPVRGFLNLSICCFFSFLGLCLVWKIKVYLL